MRNPSTITREEPLLPQLEKARAQQRRPSTAKTKCINKITHTHTHTHTQRKRKRERERDTEYKPQVGGATEAALLILLYY